MSSRVACPCGWEGVLPSDVEAGAARCPMCGQPISTEERRESIPPGAIPDSDAKPDSTSPAVPPAVGSGRAAFDFAVRKLQVTWSYVRRAFAFYWGLRTDLRTGLRRWLLQYLPALEDPDRVRREIRIPLRESERVTFDDGQWRVQLPSRCVVCGARGSREPKDTERDLLDPFPLLASPLVVAAVAVFFGWWYQSLLLFLILLPAGPLIGYALRRVETVGVEFERCTRHSDATRVPEFQLWHGELFLWTGAREVRQAFFGKLFDAEGPSTDDGPYVPPELPISPPVESVALADDVPDSSQIVHETSRRMAAEDEAQDLFGPTGAPLTGSQATHRTNSQTHEPEKPDAPAAEGYGLSSPASGERPEDSREANG